MLPVVLPVPWQEFVAEAVRRWVAAAGSRSAFIEPGSPWENGYIENFNARLCDEFLNGEIFYTLKKAQVLVEAWRHHYNAAGRTGRSCERHLHRWQLREAAFEGLAGGDLGDAGAGASEDDLTRAETAARDRRRLGQPQERHKRMP